jgi:hypothetical protein
MDTVELILFMAEGSKPATARIFLDGVEKEQKWQVSDSTPWKYDVSACLQGGNGLTFEVQRKTGDFVFLGAHLDLQCKQSAPASIPEPSASILLGTALVGLTGIRRKLKK